MIQIDYDLKDIIISAFRYALGRKTYITLSTCDYIKNHPEIIDKRVKNVLLRDLEQLNFFYVKNELDYEIFTKFKKWLESTVDPNNKIEMLQQVVDTNEVTSEVYDYLESVHKNTKLINQQQEFQFIQ